MGCDQDANELVSLSGADMMRFHRNAPAALARRNSTFYWESSASAGELIVMGLMPMIGMLWFGWSGGELLMFLLVGAWVGILCEVARLALAGDAAKRFWESGDDDQQVWTIVGALRRNDNKVRRGFLNHRYTRSAEWRGVGMDFLVGGVATAWIIDALTLGGLPATDAIYANPSLGLSLAALVGFQMLAAAWEIARHRRLGAEGGNLKTTPGLRGVLLFLLLMIITAFGQPRVGQPLEVGRAMLAVNSFFVAAGALWLFCLLMMRREAAWLQTYLDERSAKLEKISPQAHPKAGRRRGAK